SARSRPRLPPFRAGNCPPMNIGWTDSSAFKARLWHTFFSKKTLQLVVTSVIPTVFAVADDPVGSGLVESLARPGGNITGLSNQQADLVGKRIELLRELTRL